MINAQFQEMLEKVRKKISKTDLFIMIWGPGEAADTLEKRKRFALKESLSETFGENNVFFPEDRDLREFRDEVGNYAAEYHEAEAADIIFVIAESPGSITELALLGKEFASKIVVFVKHRKECEQGFAREAYRGLNVEPIELEEWRTCKRVNRIAQTYAETSRVNKYRNATRGRC